MGENCRGTRAPLWGKGCLPASRVSVGSVSGDDLNIINHSASEGDKNRISVGIQESGIHKTSRKLSFTNYFASICVINVIKFIRSILKSPVIHWWILTQLNFSYPNSF